MLSLNLRFLEWIALKLIGDLVWADIALMFCRELVKIAPLLKNLTLMQVLIADILMKFFA